MFRKIGAWIDQQTGIITMIHEFMDEPLGDKVGWPHIFGSGVAFAFLLQVLTGAFMMVYYVPSPDHAHETVEYMQSLAFGRIVRGLHHFGATAMVVLVGIHLLQVFIWGAYKRPRQMIWVIGVGLLALVMGFSFTGYLLPWDQKAYWATIVGTNIAGSIPVLGHFMRAVLRAGENVGAATITRFFAIHVFFLPAATALLIVFHIFQVRRHGITPSWAAGEPDNQYKPQRFYPDQVFKDLVFAVILLGVLLFFAAWHGAPLEPMANPSDTNYVPRPEWYFLPLFQLLKYLPGKYGEFVGAIVLPSIGVFILLLFPYVDRNPHRLPQKRPVAMGLMVFTFVAVTIFGIQGVHSIPPKTKLSPKAQRGEKIFLDLRCTACHPVNGVGGDAAPDLGQAPKRDSKTLETLLRDPTSFKARTIMPAVDIPHSDMVYLIAFLQQIDKHYLLAIAPTVGPKKPSSHFEQNWFLAHKFEVRKDPTYCESCHKPHFCQTCHQHRRPDSHLDHWIRHHFGVASENPNYCKACHVRSFCDNCHKDVMHTQDWPTRHGVVAKEKRELCAQCHEARTCAMCHSGAKPSSHTDNWLSRHGKQASQQCQTCHEQSFCENCHMGARPQSHTPDWPRVHGATAKSGKQKCSQCHSTSFCNSCHGTQMPHAVSFRQGGHGAIAKQTPETCARCHKQDFCTGCHGLVLPHSDSFKQKSHGDTAQQSPQVCAKCHQSQFCGTCHKGENRPAFHRAKGFLPNHGKQASGHETLCTLCHGQNACVKCHGLELPHSSDFQVQLHGGQAQKNPAICAKCHQPSKCKECHDGNPPQSHAAQDFVTKHGKQAKGNEAFCVLCHGGKFCEQCHDQPIAPQSGGKPTAQKLNLRRQVAVRRTHRR